MNHTESTTWEEQIAKKYHSLSPFMDERLRRLWVATETRALGYGGQSIVHRATGVSLPTIEAGLRELNDEPSCVPPERVRQSGGGRKPLTQIDPTLQSDLESLVEPATCGDPESPLLWISKSLSQIKDAL